MVVCASHLGYYPNPRGDEIGDTQVAAQVDGIDFIASGHTHTFMTTPVITKQPQGGNTIIFQVGRSGIYVGRVDLKLRDGKIIAAAAVGVIAAGALTRPRLSCPNSAASWQPDP